MKTLQAILVSQILFFELVHAQFMPLAFWKTPPSSGAAPGPCDVTTPTVGIDCEDGTIYVGKDGNGYKLAIPQGGCSYEPSGSATTTPTSRFTATCPGTGTDPRKQWGTLNTTTGVTSTTDGVTNTWTLATSYSDSAAARYCYYMSYGGWSDWYLPSTGEIDVVIANKTLVTANSKTAWPTTNYYWTSREWNSTVAYGATLFNNASNFALTKNDTANNYIRCIRKIGPSFIASLPTPGNFADDLTATGLDYDFNGSATTIVLTIKNKGTANTAGVTSTITGAFSVTGGTCSPSTPLNYGNSCTVEITSISTNRIYNGTSAGRLKISDAGRSLYVTLTGTTFNAPDPCAATTPTLGAVCSDGGIYVGKDGSNNKLVITPGGCAYEPSGNTNSVPSSDFTATCTGANDAGGTMSKSFGSRSVYAGAGSTSNGPSNTTILSAASSPAARFCDKMVFGGRIDWYLPAHDELTVVATNRSAINTNNPTFIASGAPSTSTPGLGAAEYNWTSTESTTGGWQDFAYQYRMLDASGGWASKGSNLLVRCMRRY